jgi:hypothetical protein
MPEDIDGIYFGYNRYVPYIPEDEKPRKGFRCRKGTKHPTDKKIEKAIQMSRK